MRLNTFSSPWSLTPEPQFQGLFCSIFKPQPSRAARRPHLELSAPPLLLSHGLLPPQGVQFCQQLGLRLCAGCLQLCSLLSALLLLLLHVVWQLLHLRQRRLSVGLQS